MAGLVLAGTASARRIQRLVLPLRDAFAALFFFAFGLSIDVGDFGEVVAPAVAAVAMSIVLAVIAGVGVARINGLDREAAANIAFTVVARGEFALILVALAIQAGLDGRLAPFVALYVLALAVISPLLAAQSRHVAALIPCRLVPDVGPAAAAPEHAEGGPDRGARHHPDRVGRPRRGRGEGSRAPGDWLRWLERCLHTAEVTGSSPVSPTRCTRRPAVPPEGRLFCLPGRAWRSGALGEVVEPVQRRPHLAPRARELAVISARPARSPAARPRPAATAPAPTAVATTCPGSGAWRRCHRR